jgi:hypothetical protein
MAEPIVETPIAAVPSVPEPIQQPVATEAPEPVPESFPPPVMGDTPLSGIERLSSASDLDPRSRRRDRVLTAAWAISFAALAAFGVAGYTQRDLLMKQWPASKRVYATLGLIPADAKSGDAKPADGPPAH